MTTELLEYISNELLSSQKPDGISEETDLLGGNLLDSMAIIKLISHIEKKFSIKIPAEDMVLENFMTVQAIGTYLQSRDIDA